MTNRIFGFATFVAVISLVPLTLGNAFATELPNCDTFFSKRTTGTNGTPPLTIACAPGGPPQLVYLIDPQDPKGDPKLCGCNATWVRCNPNLNNPAATGSPEDTAAAATSRLLPCSTKTSGLKAIPSTFEYINDGTSACTTSGGTRICFRAR